MQLWCKACGTDSVNYCSMLHAIMTKENSRSKSETATMRVTRARARTLGQSGGLPPLHPSAKQEEKRVLRSNFKRAASDENKSTLSNATSRHKRRAVLGDVTNLVCETSYMNCINATKIQVSYDLLIMLCSWS